MVNEGRLKKKVLMSHSKVENPLVKYIINEK